jgi:outer membrane protein assembly factor BamB
MVSRDAAALLSVPSVCCVQRRADCLELTVLSVFSVDRIAPLMLLAWLTATPQAQPPRARADASVGQILALDPRWTLSFETAPSASAGFDEEMAYVPLESGEVVAVDLDRGLIRWTAALTTAFTPATGDGMVFAGGDGTVAALDQRTGELLWRVPLGGTLSRPVYWDSGWVIASTEEGELVALGAEDGRIAWRNPLGSPLAVAPAPAQERLYLALADGRLVAIDLVTGATLWTMALNEPVTGLLALDEQVLVGTRANLLHSVSLDRPRLRWTQKAGADVAGAPAADENLIYVVAFDNVLRALQRRTGNVRWTRNLPSRPSGGPLRADDVVLVPLSTQDIVAYRATTGVQAFSVRAAGELGGAPFLREAARPTAPRLVAMSREGALQGFAPRFEAPPQQLTELPGVKVGG